MCERVCKIQICNVRCVSWFHAYMHAYIHKYIRSHLVLCLSSIHTRVTRPSQSIVNTGWLANMSQLSDWYAPVLRYENFVLERRSVHECVCVYVYIRTCVYTYVCIIRVYMHMYTYYTYICIKSVHKCVCVCACMNSLTYNRKFIHGYIYTYHMHMQHYSRQCVSTTMLTACFDFTHSTAHITASHNTASGFQERQQSSHNARGHLAAMKHPLPPGMRTFTHRILQHAQCASLPRE